MFKKRASRRFNPSVGLELTVRELERRFLAASSHTHDPDFIPAILLFSPLQSRSSPYSQVAPQNVTTAPGFLIAMEPGIYSFSIDRQAPSSPFLFSDTGPGTEQSKADIGGDFIPPPWTGDMISQVGNAGDLYAEVPPYSTPTIGGDCAMKHDVSQNSVLTGGWMGWIMPLTSVDGTGTAPGGAPLP